MFKHFLRHIENEECLMNCMELEDGLAKVVLQSSSIIKQMIERFPVSIHVNRRESPVETRS